MYLTRTHGKNFQSLKKFDIHWPLGGACVTGPNMSGKTSSCRAPVWGAVGKFPYPGLGAFSNDLVLPAEEDDQPQEPGADAKPSRKKKKSNKVTIVENFYVFPAVSNAKDQETRYVTYRSVRAYDPSSKKVFFMLEDENKTIRLYGKAALNTLLNLANIPDGTINERVKLFIRKVWYGEGQDTSFFDATPAMKKKIIEAAHPFKKLPKYELDSTKRLKSLVEKRDETQRTFLEQRGILIAKKEELLLKLTNSGHTSPFAPAAVYDVHESLSILVNHTQQIVEKILSDENFSIEKKEQAVRHSHQRKSLFEQNMSSKKRLEELRKGAITAEESIRNEQIDITGLERQLTDLDGILSLIDDAKAKIQEADSISNQASALDNGVAKISMEKSAIEQDLKKISNLSSTLSHAEMLARKILISQSVDSFQGNHEGKGKEEAYLSSFHHFIARAVKIKANTITEISEALLEKLTSDLDLELSSLPSDKDLEALRGAISEKESEITSARAKIDALLSAFSQLDGLKKEEAFLQENLATLEKEFIEVDSDRLRAEAAHSLSNEILSLFGETGTGDVNQAKVTLKNALSALSVFESGIKKLTHSSLEQISVLSVLRDRLAVAQEFSLSLASMKEEEDKTKTELKAIWLNSSSVTSQISALEKRLKNYKESLSAAKVDGASCEHCGGPLSDEHLSDLLHSESLKVESLKEELSSLKMKEKEKDQKIKDISDCIIDISKKMKQEEDIILKTVDAANIYKQGTTSDSSSILSEIENLLLQKHLKVDAVSKKLEETSKRIGTLNIEINETIPTVVKLFSESNITFEGADLVAHFKIFEKQRREKIDADKASLSAAIERKKNLTEKKEEILLESFSFLDAVGSNGESSFLKDLSIASDKMSNDMDQLSKKHNDIVSKKLVLEKNVADIKDSIRKNFDIADGQDIAQELSQAAQGCRDESKKIKATISASGERRKHLDELNLLACDLEKRIPKEMLSLDEAAITEALLEYDKQIERAEADLASAQRVSELSSSCDMARLLLQRYLALWDSVEELEDKVNALTVLKAILAPNGDARTMALGNDVAGVVQKTNDFLRMIGLGHNLAIDLKLEKDDDEGAPVIQIKFEVDGSTSRRILPSKSQRHILGLCTDIAVKQLSTRDSVIFVDEPETGLDSVNRPKLTQFLKSISPQAILMTNTAAEGFSDTISTDDIRNSLKEEPTEADFDVDFSLKDADEESLDGQGDGEVQSKPMGKKSAKRGKGDKSPVPNFSAPLEEDYGEI